MAVWQILTIFCGSYLLIGALHVIVLIRREEITEKDGGLAFALFVLWPVLDILIFVIEGWSWLVKTISKKKEEPKQLNEPPPEGDWK